MVKTVTAKDGIGCDIQKKSKAGEQVSGKPNETAGAEPGITKQMREKRKKRNKQTKNSELLTTWKKRFKADLCSLA